jgi:glutamine amidotransferase
MCELFGLSSSAPLEVRYSLHAFAEHGGLLHPNKSGWGIVCHEGNDARLIKQPVPASDSPVVRFVESRPLESACFVAHVRYATAGAPSYANTHPFLRELGGRAHFFAHNGGFPDIWTRLPLDRSGFRPVGETDSEHAFCVLLNRLAPLWRGSDTPPPVADRLAIVAETAAALRQLGAANFLYSDGDVLFAHADKRSWDEGNGQFSAPRAPGLSVATRGDLITKGLHATAPQDGTTALYLASVPLTEEGWTPLPEGTVLALRDGAELARHTG